MVTYQGFDSEIKKAHLDLQEQAAKFEALNLMKILYRDFKLIVSVRTVTRTKVIRYARSVKRKDASGQPYNTIDSSHEYVRASWQEIQRGFESLISDFRKGACFL